MKIEEYMQITADNLQSLSEKNEQQEILLSDLKEKEFKNHNMTIYWSTIDKQVKVPSKRSEDAGLDIYTTELPCTLKPGETKFFTTGLRSIFPENYWVEIKERGSTGAIGLSVRSGVIDSGYRGEWKILLTNVNKFPVEFSHEVNKITYVYGKIFKKRIKKVIYPLGKAIAQAVVIPLPNITSERYNNILTSDSQRGEGGWGSSGK